MAGEKILLTPEGKKELEDELYRREHETRAEVGDLLREARGFGDLSENAEYDGAREAQSENETRIAEIRRMLASAEVVDVSRMDQSNLTAAVGTTVELEDGDGKRTSFSLVGAAQTNSLKRRISDASPAGSAIVGHMVGDEISFTTPAGKVRKYKIVDITITKGAGSDVEGA
ncbi:MAG: transcription elongation factor GreA [Coriobacteriales bacterium]|nr:transcription elongation factor GreA [Coriobacteriales bacterium]